ncbi:hypothetical protein KAR91_17795 [Candidatus Pacearchaeota archaeon]|nr:hypothetical protein [Candidatus Pacearchaeota archaeon]
MMKLFPLLTALFCRFWNVIRANGGYIVIADEQRSGSKGNTTFSRNKGGAYARSRATPTNPNTNRQQAARSVFGSRASAWNTLTEVQRAQWDTYAETHTTKNALGQDIHISGMSWYVMLNSRLADAGSTLKTTPPPTTAMAALTTMTCTFTDEDTISVAFTGTVSGTGKIQLWQTPPGSKGSSPNQKQSRLVGYSALAPTTPEAFESPFTMIDQQKSVFFGRVMDSHGQVSAFVEDNEIYNAP